MSEKLDGVRAYWDGTYVTVNFKGVISNIQYQILKSSLLRFELLLKLRIFFCRNFFSRLGNPFYPTRLVY